MTAYILFIALLILIYTGFKVIRARETKRMSRYYGYRNRNKVQQHIKQAA